VTLGLLAVVGVEAYRGGQLTVLAHTALALVLAPAPALTLGLEEPVDLGRGKASEKLLGHGVLRHRQHEEVKRGDTHDACTHRGGLAVLGAVLLVSLHGLEPGGAADKLVRELGLVLRVVGVDVAAGMSGARARDTRRIQCNEEGGWKWHGANGEDGAEGTSGRTMEGIDGKEDERRSER
jgi:hypothetical protein